MDRQQKKKMTWQKEQEDWERAEKLREMRNFRNGNQMTALRFQTGWCIRHPCRLNYFCFLCTQNAQLAEGRGGEGGGVAVGEWGVGSALGPMTPAQILQLMAGWFYPSPVHPTWLGSVIGLSLSMAYIPLQCHLLFLRIVQWSCGLGVTMTLDLGFKPGSDWR